MEEGLLMEEESREDWFQFFNDTADTEIYTCISTV